MRKSRTTDVEKMNAKYLVIDVQVFEEAFFF